MLFQLCVLTSDQCTQNVQRIQSISVDLHCKDRSSQSTSVDPSLRYFGKQPAFAQACFLDLSQSDLLMKRLFDSKEIREPYRATQLTLGLRN